ncbi:protein ABHD18-like [Glandiceps talaboti]
MSRLDVLYRSLVLTKFFTRGWGKPDSLKRIFEFQKTLTNRETGKHLVDRNYPIYVDKDEVKGECRLIDGHFLSPLQVHLPGIMPKEIETARFQMILPKKWKTDHKPICIHLAGTGDHYFWRRRTMMARPLLKEYGIASILLENPYYGSRKPKEQIRSSLHNVSDLFVMGGALILESAALLHWCERQGFGPLGLTGISMGGHMATLAASCWHKPIALVPCLSWSSATPVFTEGVLSHSIPWKLLQTQYECHQEYEEEIMSLLNDPGKTAFDLGQEYVRNYPERVTKLKKLLNEESQSSNIAENHTQKDKISPSPSIHDCPEMFDITINAETEACQKEVSVSSGVLHGVQMKDTQQQYSSSSNNNSVNDASTLGKSKENSESVDTKQTKKGKTKNIMEKILPVVDLRRKKSPDSNLKVTKEFLRLETMKFMRGVMDETTYLGNFPVPVDPSLVVVVSAIRDAYIPTNDVPTIQELWPGSHVRYLDCGHIHAALLKTHEFRRAIHDAFQMGMLKYSS